MVNNKFQFKVLLLVLGFLSGFVLPTCGQGNPYILGPTDFQDYARSQSLQGIFNSIFEDVPPGANVIVLGDPDVLDGINDSEAEGLLDDGCKALRLCGKNRMELSKNITTYKNWIAAGNDPFPDVAKTMGFVQNEKLFPYLAKTELTSPERTFSSDKFESKPLFFPTKIKFEKAKSSRLETQIDQKGKVVLNILFDLESATIKARSIPILKQVLELLKDRASSKFIIAGHTDNSGAPDYNLSLSKDRANSVKNWLVNNGISSGRLSTKGYGETKPITTNFTAEGRSRNRRVELIKE